MPYMRATTHGIDGTLGVLERLSPKYWAAPALNDVARQYRKDLGKVIKDTYATRYSLTHINRLMITSRATKADLEAKITVRYEAHKLSMFIVRQTAITFGGTRKRVVSNKRGAGFSQSKTSQRAVSTLVKVLNSGRMKLVHGSKGYKGFLQDRNGNILERSQQATWAGKRRLATHALYGLSISQMSGSRRVQTRLDQGDYLTKMANSIKLT